MLDYILRFIRLKIDKYRYHKILKKKLYEENVGLFIESNDLSEFEIGTLIKKGFVVFSGNFIIYYISGTTVKIYNSDIISDRYSYVTKYDNLHELLESIYSLYLVTNVISSVVSIKNIYDDPKHVFIDINSFCIIDINTVRSYIEYKEELWIRLF